MKNAGLCNCKSRIITLLYAVFVMAMTHPAQAYYYVGGDWGGSDLTLNNGDILSGCFANIGLFSIPVGATVSGMDGNLSLIAGKIVIDGSLNGDPLRNDDLSLTATADITLNGALNSWRSINLTAESIALNAGSSVALNNSTTPWFPPPGTTANGGIVISSRNLVDDPSLRAGDLAIKPIDGGQFTAGGGTITLNTPLPAAALLLGSGLAGLVGILRRTGKYI